MNHNRDVPSDFCRDFCADSGGELIGGAGAAAQFTFTREQRLLTGRQFKNVFAKPRRSSDRYFTVLARDNGCERARLGLAVAKKRIRLLVGRNRIKRLVRESFRHHADSLGAVDVVVMSRFDGRADNASLMRSLRSHWKRIGSSAALVAAGPSWPILQPSVSRRR